jgi:FlaA1/EpsC-like NDP-sugar epimerase
VKMITLAGFEPEKDIKIVETGIRPGEKLFEELLATAEDNMPTYNPKIMISRTRKYNHKNVVDKISALTDAVSKEDDKELVSRLIDLVEEYKPMNDKYKS